MSLLAGAFLVACDELQTSARPAPRVAPPPTQTVEPPATTGPSEQSQALAAYYTGVQRMLLAQGLLRTDGGGPDTPFSTRQLVENFIKIGVFNEFTQFGETYSRVSSAGRVQRWKTPAQVSLIFGDSVPDVQRRADTAFITNYAARLSRITGHKMTVTRDQGNFHVAVLDVDELSAFAPQLKALIPGLTDAVATQIIDMPRRDYCVVYTFADSAAPHTLKAAIAIIRAEHPELLRKSCYHEEIAQGLGLGNDSPNARPSIFNDDEEFAFLTAQDELLLKILYDERLPLGARPQEARPLVEVIAQDYLGGES